MLQKPPKKNPYWPQTFVIIQRISCFEKFAVMEVSLWRWNVIFIINVLCMEKNSLDILLNVSFHIRKKVTLALKDISVGKTFLVNYAFVEGFINTRHFRQVMAGSQIPIIFTEKFTH